MFCCCSVFGFRRDYHLDGDWPFYSPFANGRLKGNVGRAGRRFLHEGDIQFYAFLAADDTRATIRPAGQAILWPALPVSLAYGHRNYRPDIEIRSLVFVRTMDTAKIRFRRFLPGVNNLPSDRPGSGENLEQSIAVFTPNGTLQSGQVF